MMRIVYEKTGEHPDGTLFTLEKGVATIPEDNHIVGVLGCSRCVGRQGIRRRSGTRGTLPAVRQRYPCRIRLYEYRKDSKGGGVKDETSKASRASVGWRKHKRKDGKRMTNKSSRKIAKTKLARNY